jgi:RNA polymerase sigma factor (sigma-70 family)
MTREERILSLSREVHFLAKKMAFRISLVALDDLESSGWLGAIYAVDHWKASKGILLATYASRRIWGSMQDYLRSLDFVNRGARTRYKKAVALASENREHLPPHPGRSVEFTAKHENIGDPRSECPYRKIETHEALASVIEKADLDERELQILRRYDLGEEKLTDVGRDFGVSQSRTTQLRTRLFEKLRAVVAA